MTEKEKMLNSQMYNPMGDKQLRNERCSVKNLCRSCWAERGRGSALSSPSGATTATISNSVRISIQTTIW